MKQYVYKVKNKHGDLEDYSKPYPTMCEALAWYADKTKGAWLEKEFNRDLILCEVDR